MEILNYQKIEASFNPWSPVYCDVAKRLIDVIQTEQFEVIHIGSTSFKVGGKGIIDLSVLYKNDDLNEAVEHLRHLGFQDQISEKPFPKERPRKDATVRVDGIEYCVHVHVIQSGSEEHQKQLDYKNYMLDNPAAREAYEASKKAILANGFTDQESYGKQKSPYVKSILNAMNASK